MKEKTMAARSWAWELKGLRADTSATYVTYVQCGRILQITQHTGQEHFSAQEQPKSSLIPPFLTTL